MFSGVQNAVLKSYPQNVQNFSGARPQGTANAKAAGTRSIPSQDGESPYAGGPYWLK